MAHRRIHSDGPEEPRIRPMRSGSLSSEVVSASGMSSSPSPPSVSIPPVYIAALGAAQLLSAEVRETVGVSVGALELVNGFLDQILFDILRTASSNALPQLRNAIPLVLKPRLGKVALKAADDELREYLEDSDDDQQQSTAFPRRGDFNLDLAWKLARLRCMVYTRLGDLEEEDEEEIIEKEGIEHDSDGTRSMSHLGPASAIFLTSILEFIGEQALYYAAQHAQKRSQNVAQQEGSDVLTESHSADHPQLVIEEVDMSQIGRESSLSRLWRSWKRSARFVREPVSRPLSPETTMNSQPVSPTDLQAPGGAALASIISETDEIGGRTDQERLPSQIPLPMSSRDVDEIEVPGLAPELDGPAGESLTTPEATKRRPMSMVHTSANNRAVLTPESVNDTPRISEATRKRPGVKHTRSSSVPTPAQSPLTTPRRANEGNEFGQFPVPPAGNSNAVTNESESVSQDSQSGSSEHGINKNDGEHERAVDNVSHAHPERPATTLNDHDDRQVGKVAAALSAVAGTLGLSAAVNYLQPHHQPEAQESLSDQLSADDNLSGRSSATEDPHHGRTNASGASDAKSGVAEVAPIAYTQRRGRDPTAEVSDPEDLALSSEEEEDDEKDMIRRSPVLAPSQNAERSAPLPINSPSSFLHDAEPGDEEEEQHIPTSIHSSPSSRKRPADYAAKAINRQAVVISQPPHHDDEDEQSLEYHDAASRQRGSGQGSQNMTSPLQDRGDIIPSSPTKSGSARDQYISSSERLGAEAFAASMYSTSSGARPPPAHAATTSKSSARTQHSKSSSSSSQLLGFDREQHTRTSGVFPMSSNEPNNTGIAGMAKSKKPSHLRLRTDDEIEEGETKKKSLEMLIRSDETLHYTLTPSSARAEQFTIPSKPKSQTQELADFFRDTKPPGDDTSRSRVKRNNVPTSLNGLRANPAGTGPPMTQQKYIPSSKNVPPTPTTPKTKSSLGSPREARVERDNIRDLADYARSTGPDGPGQLPKALPNSTAQSKPGSSAGTTSSRPSAGSRSKFQARDATVSRHADSSGLIDFIREGPPRAAGDHRIDRKVAPFRSTMDSDDLNGIAPSQNTDHNGTASVASTQNSSIARSMQSSMNSRTALLDSSNRSNSQSAAPTKQSAGMTLRQSALAGDGNMPKRTRRRVRDPYAISDSDDDDLEVIAPPPKPKTQDESLIDFLRNTAPPPNMTTRPIMTSDSSTTSSSTIRPQSSNPGLKDRLFHTAAMNGMNRKMSNTTRPSRDTESPPTNVNSAARPESPHLTQMGTKMDSYRPTKLTHASIMERNRQRGKIEAREPRTGGNTSDLAEFMRSSGPPPSAKVGEAKEDEDAMKEQAGFRKFFGRNRSFKS